MAMLRDWLMSPSFAFYGKPFLNQSLGSSWRIVPTTDSSFVGESASLQVYMS
jgi:hypothetical protein